MKKKHSPMSAPQRFWIFLGTVLTVAFGNTRVANAEHSESVNPSSYDLTEIVVTATRIDKAALRTPSIVHVLDIAEIQKRRQARTIPEALVEVPGIMVQKTGHGQGSPFIRGFTGFRTLFLIDGIRLNNSIFRDGPNQYWNTVDPLSVNRLEIVMGPSSVLYGSDAIGGTVNAFTRNYEDIGDGHGLDGSIYYRYSDAENANVGRVDFGYSNGGNIELTVGLSIKDFGDLEGGSEIGNQPMTGYEEIDADFKLQYTVAPDRRWIVAHQRVAQDDAWRTHKTIFGKSWQGTTVGDEMKRALDQRRQLTYVQYHAENLDGWIDGLHTSVSHQVQNEERLRIRSDGRADHQGVDVITTGLSVQLDSEGANGPWVYGFEYYHDDVGSFRRDLNADGSLRRVRIQGPVGDDAEYDQLGLYLQKHLSMSGNLDWQLGVRYTYAGADADKVQDPVGGSSISVSDNWDALTASVRFLYSVDEQDRWKVFGGISQGFRAPNLSDLTRFDSARTNEIETPVFGLDPEDFVSYEIGLKTNTSFWSAQLAYYYTDIQNLIVRTPTGNLIDGENEVTKQNSSDGFVQGIELQGLVRLASDFAMYGNLTWVDGEVSTFPTSNPANVTEPLDRLMPLTVNIGIRWEPQGKNYWLEGLVSWAERQTKLSSRDQSDTQRIPPGGTPGYTVLHLRSGWQLTENTWFSAGLDNVTNEDYRVHGSGLNQPGRNFKLSVGWNTK